jgi:hypothetical protein
MSAQLPVGLIDLTEGAFSHLLQELNIKIEPTGSVYEEIYPFPSDSPVHPRYSYILACINIVGESLVWKGLDVEIDSGIPGQVKAFRKAYTVCVISWVVRLHQATDGDLLLLSSLPYGASRRPLSVRFLRVGKQDVWRAANVQGIIEKMCRDGKVYH